MGSRAGNHVNLTFVFTYAEVCVGVSFLFEECLEALEDWESLGVIPDRFCIDVCFVTGRDI